MRIIAATCLLLVLSCNATFVQAAPYLDEKARGEFMLKAYRSNPKGWNVLCHSSDLHVAIRNDATHLYVLAITWRDNDNGLGMAPGRNRQIGDYSTLMVHIGSGKKRVDGDFDVYLNPWPETPGIQLARYTQDDIKGALAKSDGSAGSIEYAPFANTRIRVDRYKIALSEIGLAPGSTFRTAFYVSSARPELSLNSAGLTEADEYFPEHVPVSTYKEVTLQAFK